MSRATNLITETSSNTEAQVKATRSRTKQIHTQSATTTQQTMSRDPECPQKEATSDIEHHSSMVIDWNAFRELEQRRLKSILVLDDEKKQNFDNWLRSIEDVYDQLHYPSAIRVQQALSYLQNNEKRWYEREQFEINGDWEIFRKKLKEHIDIQLNLLRSDSADGNHENELTDHIRLKRLIEEKVGKFKGDDNGGIWLMRIFDFLKNHQVPDYHRLQIIQDLLEGSAYSWYFQRKSSIENFETFAKLFEEKYCAMKNSNIDGDFDLNLSTTMAREIIKSPIIFRGNNEDVFEWIEKIERRFRMANWNETNKLRFISTHLEDDAYRWWSQAEDEIKSWPLFIESISRAFGSTRSKEVSFEQLKWYKQSMNQSITQYYDKIMELCKKVDPTMSDTIKLQYLMAGVRDSLKIQISLHDPQTSTAFLSYARKVEDVFRLTNTNYSNDYQNTEESNFQGYDAMSMKNNVQITPKEFHSQGQMTSKMKMYDKLKDNHTRTNHQYRRYTSNQATRTCYRCGNPGHYARYCNQRHFQ